jgi:[histone H3]-N6,N6-dimethyl-L-lysine4 FAD-dependent demethylase
VAAVRCNEYRLPDPIILSDVIATVPLRYHELVAAVFEYLEGTGKINIGAVRLPHATREPTSSAERVAPKSRKRIVIIGAGMAGLAAARQLMFFGHEVLVLEARDRPGGRVCTNRRTMGVPVDEGAMITTGEEPNPFALIVRQLGLRTHRISNLQVCAVLHFTHAHPHKKFTLLLELA